MARLGTALTARAPLAELVEQAKIVEALGYDRIWLPEISGRDSFVTGAVLAIQTASIGIGLGVVPLPSRPLPALEMATAALAECAPGRIAVGLGAGHRETAASQFGWPGSSSATAVGEAVVALREALRSATLQHRGADGAAVSLALRGQHVDTPPELFIGALRPLMVTVAARNADGMLLNWVTESRAARLCELADRYRTGGDFVSAAYVPVCVVDGSAARDAAYAEVASQLSSYLQLSAYGDLLVEDGYAEEVEAVRAARRSGLNPVAAVSARLVEAVAVIGDADEVRAGLGRLRAAGIDEPVLAPVAVGTDSAASLLDTWAALAE